ncbi:DEAD/DEAH box helicase [Mobilicoccus pelagius]|uniref:Putative ATP-dependent RNA helicase n=1 Tax=Mobilicoccus pelagius NBRC 104925 TaxID=1089455 RepID=H5UVR9_9MICO|nr:DEAD/DEAH box helicase [Mobilicoccus pelagius]GAB49827.1 putative ATP-dependent RNA helicase [Mobilicoccus pelagius NBRC 104925]
MTTSAFARLGVPAALVSVLEDAGITDPTPIQTATLPDSLAGRDVLGRGRTGSGKTYAFCLPLVARLAESKTPRRPGRPRALILVPTRELARQVEASLAPLAKAMGLRTLLVFGGVGQNPQVQGLQKGVDVLVACPGRLEDLIGQGHCRLDAIEIAILDEADHMADLGFLPGVKRILAATPKDGQRLLFSATLDAGVGVIADRFLHDPVTHHADSAQSPVSKMDHHVLHINAADRLDVVAGLTGGDSRTVVFTRTKYGAKKLAKQLNQAGVSSVELHGNLGQNARVRNLDAFHNGDVTTLVATDIAARGIHVDDVELVVHADPPVEHKAYLHRSGRTARAGAAGTVVTLMTDEQVKDVRLLTKAAGINPTTTRVTAAHPLLAELAPQGGAATGEVRAPIVPPAAPERQGRSGGRGRGEGRSRRGESGRGDSGGQGRRRGGSGGDARRSAEQGEQRAAGGGRGRRGGYGRGGASSSSSTQSSRSAGQSSGRGQGSSQGAPRREGGGPGGAAAFSSRSSAGRRR